MTRTQDFNIAAAHTWLNCAHQGPMPRKAINALQGAAGLKEDPSNIMDQHFFDIPARLKQTLGEMFSVPAQEIILGDSATYTLLLLVNGINWRVGDEILVQDGDFPTNIYPWLVLEARGVKVKKIIPEAEFITATDISDHCTAHTRLLCLSWVNSFNGHVIDIEAIGKVCKENKVLFVLNGSQAFGYKPLKFADSPADVAFGCGYKWLLGPYGTGFGWIRPELRNKLLLHRYYWLGQYEQHLEELTDYTIRSPENYLDVCNTANFFNFIPWQSSLDYILQTGIPAIGAHNALLVKRFTDNLDPDKYCFITPAEQKEVSAIVVFSALDATKNKAIQQKLTDKGIYTSIREGNIRVSPHVYNTFAQIDLLLDTLHL